MRRGKQRVVRYTRKDGTEVEKRYARKPPTRTKTGPEPDTVKAALHDWVRSPAFTKKALTTQKLYWQAIARLDKFHPFALRDLKRRHLLQIMDALSDRPGACRTFITGVSAWLNWCVDRELIEHTPAARLKRPKLGKWKAWSADDLQAVWAAAPEPLRRAMMLSLYTGQRIGDVLKMRWDQWDGKALRLTQTKTLQPVVIPAHEELRAELERWRADPAVGITILVAPWQRPWLYSSFSGYWDRWKTDNGFDHLQWHGLRSNALHALLTAGCTTWEAAAITGHRSLKQVEDYARDLAREGLAASAISRLQTKTTNLR